MTMIDTHPRSPFRAPDWRWIRATTLRRESLRAGRGDDGWVSRALRLQAALDRLDGAPDHRRLARADPTLLAAHRLRLGDERIRWEVEARLLAGQDDDAIAARTGIPAAVVEAFEAIFHNVRDRLEALGWVDAMVLGPGLYRGLAPEDVELAWKVSGYHFGPLALDALIGSSGEIVADSSRSTADRLRTALAALTLPVIDETAPKLIRLAARLRQVEHEAASRASAAVFAPIELAGVAGHGPVHLVGSKPQTPSLSPAGFVEIERAEDVGGRDEDDRLPATFAPLVFHPPAVQIATTRRETA